MSGNFSSDPSHDGRSLLGTAPLSPAGLAALAEVLLRCDSPRAVDEKVLSTLAEAWDASCALSWEPRGVDDELVLKRHLDLGRTDRPRGGSPPAAGGGVLLAWASREPHRVYAHEAREETGIVELALPLVGPRGPEAVYQFLWQAREAASLPGQELLARLGGMLGAARESAGHRQALGRSAERTATLAELGRLLSSTLDPREIRERAMKAVTRLIGAERGSLLLLDRDKGDLYFDVALGEGGHRLKTVRLSLGEGLAGWSALHGEPVLVNDVSRDPRWQRKADRKSQFITRSVLCAPVRSHGRLRGVLQGVNSLAGEGFTRHDLDLLVSLADQVAISVENAELYGELRRTFFEVSHALADSIEKRDPYTGGHTGRVAAYAGAVGRRLGMDSRQLEDLRLAAVLHDIGKIGVDDAILRKPGPLAPHELEAMRRHPVLGKEIVEHISPMGRVLPGILHHHEALDGSGYPGALRGDDIPLMARVIAVADVFDAMTTDRSYRRASSAEEVLSLMEKEAGRRLDPRAVEELAAAYAAGELAPHLPASPSPSSREQG